MRQAFTLVEMLVVIVIALILFGLAVAILPSDKRAASRAADQLQGWLVQARSKAQRDQMPTGLHFIADSDGMCRRLEFVQQPEPLRLRFNGQVVPALLRPGFNNDSTIQFGQVDGVDNFRVNDLIQVKEGGGYGWYRVTGPNPINPTGPVNVTPDIPLSQPQSTIDYSIIRRWRPLAGEPILELPKGTVVDLTKNLPPPNPAQDIDSHYGRALPVIGGEVVFLFAPTGGIIDSPKTRPAVWVRHEENRGEPTLIFVGSNGSVGAHPVNDEKAPGMQNRLNRPFSFVEDGLGSGL